MSKCFLSGFLILFVISLHSSCSILKKSSRSSKKARAVVVTDSVSQHISGETFNPDSINPELVSRLLPAWKNSLAFSEFSGRAKMHFEGKGQKHDFTASFRIKRDSLIWASVSAFGGVVQVARVLITPDSLKLVNYLEKKFLQMPLEEAAKILPVPADFYSIQNLILGKPLKITGIPVNAIDSGEVLALFISDNDFSQQVYFNREDTSIRLIQMQSSGPRAPAGAIRLDNYQKNQDIPFPVNRTISVTSDGEPYFLEMNFIKTDFNHKNDYPFSVPQNYKTD